MKGHTMIRRTLLAATVLLPFAACTTPATIQAGAADAATIAAALQAIAPALLAAVTTPAQAAQIQGYINTAVAAAAAVQTAVGAAGSTALQQIISAVNALGVIVLPLVGVPPGLITVIQAALALLPTLATAAGLSSASLAKPKMAPDAARLVLKAAVK